MPGSAVWRRVASAAALIPLVAWLTIDGPTALFHVLVIALAGLTAWELGRMFERASRVTHGPLDPVLAAAVTASFVVPGAAMAVLTVAVLLTLAVPIWRRTPPSTDASTVTLLAVTYCGWLLGYAILLRELPGGGALVLLLLGITWAGDSGAYFVGSTIGRHKLAPVVSPNKTIEGSIAQVIATIIAALVLRPWLAPGWSPAFAVVVGALIGVIGQIGDLAESVIKRSLGAKDTGGLIPGHGGLLDRLDSLLFNFPAFYYLVTLGGRA